MFLYKVQNSIINLISFKLPKFFYKIYLPRCSSNSNFNINNTRILSNLDIQILSIFASRLCMSDQGAVIYWTFRWISFTSRKVYIRYHLYLLVETGHSFS
ncbi:unnamed protein product [Meloidogyne enterolobii]|uniref:Uncharacterized protein n=1 Tax=Meloidogyne enterolobii TaxID=390850 RepID=A0ACB0XRU7_MELEN